MTVSTIDVEGTLYVDVWGLYKELVHEMDSIPEDGAIYKTDLFNGLRELIARLGNTHDLD